jgi:hypothetical protein
MRQCEKELVEVQLKERRLCTVKVGGYCMKPEILSGAEVTIRSTSAEEMSPGEIAAYFIGANLFVHRLISKRAGLFVMRADNGRPDLHEIPAEAVVGKVIRIRNPSFLERVIKRICRLHEK